MCGGDKGWGTTYAWLRTLNNLSLWTHQWRLQTHLRISTCSYISGYWSVLQQFLDEGREFVIRSCMMLVSCYRECMWMMFNWSSKVVVVVFLFYVELMILTFSYDHTQRRMLGSTHIYTRCSVRQCVETPHECECMFQVFYWSMGT